MKEILCVRCAKQGKTCCQKAEVYVTPKDVARIINYTGETDFYEFRVVDNPDYLDQTDDPIWVKSIFRPDGSRRVLKRLSDGNCIMLRENGCRLPIENRPLVCRLYPYSYYAGGLYPETKEDWCPAGLTDPGETVLGSLQMSFDEVKQWHLTLYTELSEEVTNNEHRTDV